MKHLNPQQLAAVRYIDGPLLVLAGAGSGKTSVITQKIAYLVNDCGLAAQHVAAVTFTNKAAREMKERVGKLIKGKEARGLTVSTFHNLGLNLIRREIKTFGFKPGFSILDGEDSRNLIKELMLRDSELDADLVERVQGQISQWKNDLVSPEQALSSAASNGEQAMALIYQRYRQSLKAYNAVDFDDLILLPVLLFQEHPDILDKWRNRIRHLLVDEYQDTNLAQYRLVRLLVGDRGALTVVGDDDQSIYAWRGARPENLAQLQDDFPHLKVIKLEQNYRSTARILRTANTLIANNPHVFDKSLWSELGLGDPIRVIRCGNEETELERVVNEILAMRLSRQCHFRDFAVLYRGNHQSRLLEMKLQAQGIPYQLSGGTSFYARGEIKDVMAYLRLLVNPDDDNAFLRIINTPRRQIGPSTLEKLGEYASERHISLFRAIDELGLESQLGEQHLARLRKFRRWLEAVQHNCAGGEPVAAIREMLAAMAHECGKDQKPGQQRRRGGTPHGQRQPAGEPDRRHARRVRWRPRGHPRGNYRQVDTSRPAGPPGRGLRRRQGAVDDPPRRQGVGISPRVPDRHGGGNPAPPRQYRRRQYRGGAAPRLRRHHPRPAHPDPDPGRAAQAVRRHQRHHPQPLHRRTARGGYREGGLRGQQSRTAPGEGPGIDRGIAEPLRLRAAKVSEA